MVPGDTDLIVLQFYLVFSCPERRTGSETEEQEAGGECLYRSGGRRVEGSSPAGEGRREIFQ